MSYSSADRVSAAWELSIPIGPCPSPLFVTREGSRFSSFADALSAGVHRAEDASLRSHLSRHGLDVGRTLAEGVFETPVGYTTRFRDGELRFSYPEELPNYSGVDAETAVAEIRARTKQSVARCIEGAKHIGVLTSGGMDSSWLACIAAKLKSKGTKLSLIASYFEDVGDDRPFFHTLHNWTGAHAVTMLPRDSGRYVGDSMVRDAQPGMWISDANVPSVMNVVEREGIDVLLHGTPGDTLFDGDPRYALHAWRKHRYVDALRWAGTYRSIYLPTRWSAVERLLLRPLLVPKIKANRTVQKILARRRPTPDWYGEKLRTKSVQEEGQETNYDLSSAQRLLAVGDVSNRIDSWSRHEYEKRGVRMMSPYSDYDLASFVSGLDPKLLSYGSEYRGLYRRVLEGEVPPSIATRQSKSYFEREHEEIFRGADLEHLLSYARPEALARSGWVEPEAFERACTRALRTGQGWMPFYPYLCVEKWMREWGVQ